MSIKSAHLQSQKVITRPDKGLRMEFFDDRVIKRFDSVPQHPNISKAEQTNRFTCEIAAYQHFEKLCCPFVPKLLDASPDERWFAISRIHGDNILQILEKNKLQLSVESIFDQIDTMNEWLRCHGFGNMEQNIKDLILDSAGKLYIVDFEKCSIDSKASNKTDIYESIIYDILERILIRKYRKAKLTRQFLKFAFRVFIKKPFKTLILAVRCILIATWKSSLPERIKRAIQA